MIQVTIGHGVSRRFGTNLAPRKVPATRGLGIVPNPTSDNLSPQETTIQGPADVAADGVRLSGRGSSAVADTSCEKDDKS